MHTPLKKIAETFVLSSLYENKITEDFLYPLDNLSWKRKDYYRWPKFKQVPHVRGVLLPHASVKYTYLKLPLFILFNSVTLELPEPVNYEEGLYFPLFQSGAIRMSEHCHIGVFSLAGNKISGAQLSCCYKTRGDDFDQNVLHNGRVMWFENGFYEFHYI